VVEHTSTLVLLKTHLNTLTLDKENT
jgi:hypothetical protein